MRPGILKIGTLPKKSENFPASIVADVTISLKSRRRAATFLSSPKSTSVFNPRSWASSMMTQA